MGEKEKIQLIEEIKQLEREIYLKKSKLKSMEGFEQEKPFLNEAEIEKWRKTIRELINRVGIYSRGGDSVEDIRKERER
jgi:hypothetical protein